MKTRIVSLALLTGALFLVGFLSSAPQAFHSGGVAECGGCHSMHNPQDPGLQFLLAKSDQSSTCLDCHSGPTLSSYHVNTYPLPAAGTPPSNFTPGGDFAWLKKDYTFTVRGTTSTEKGDTHGHNIVAADFGYATDPSNPTAPGGSFPGTNLGCQSCHDPHGRTRRLSDGSLVKSAIGTATAPIIGSGSYATSTDPAAGQAVGVYRLLRGKGDTYDGATFNASVMAVAPATYNQSEYTNMVRVAYGGANNDTNWGTWCASCHPDMHSLNGYVHPVDASLGSTVTANYNAYVKSGDLTGLQTNSYSSLVPFVEGTASTLATLKSHASNTNGFMEGPGTATNGGRVACVSCHRAHASGFPEMLRWNMEGEFMIYNSQYPGTDTTPTVPQFARGRLGAETQAAYYNWNVTKFASYQRVLCNKCHAQD